MLQETDMKRVFGIENINPVSVIKKSMEDEGYLLEYSKDYTHKSVMDFRGNGQLVTVEVMK